jgi:hypothetical protein
VTQDQPNFMGIVSTREHISLCLAIIYCVCEPHRGLMVVEPFIHPYTFVAFQKINSEILVNKFSNDLFTSLPFLHRNLFW